MYKNKSNRSALKVTRLVALIVLFIVLFGCSAYKEDSFSQEEYQAQLLERLEKTDLLVTANNQLENEPQEHIAEGVEIYSDRFDLYVHCFYLYDGRDEVSTRDEFKRLYNNYDETLHDKFFRLCAWYRTANGEAQCELYESAIPTALDLYNNAYGPFNGKETCGDMSTADKIELEQFIRDNPDFMPREEYYDELFDLRIIDNQEYNELREQAKNEKNTQI